VTELELAVRGGSVYTSRGLERVDVGVAGGRVVTTLIYPFIAGDA
jgi:hypothetical protein